MNECHDGDDDDDDDDDDDNEDDDDDDAVISKHKISNEALETLTLPTPVVPVYITDRLIARSFSMRKPYLTVSTVGTRRSKYGISALYLNDGMIFSQGSSRRVSKSTK